MASVAEHVTEPAATFLGLAAGAAAAGAGAGRAGAMVAAATGAGCGAGRGVTGVGAGRTGSARAAGASRTGSGRGVFPARFLAAAGPAAANGGASLRSCVADCARTMALSSLSASICSATTRRMAAALARVSSGSSMTPRASSERVDFEFGADFLGGRAHGGGRLVEALRGFFEGLLHFDDHGLLRLAQASAARSLSALAVEVNWPSWLATFCEVEPSAASSRLVVWLSAPCICSVLDESAVCTRVVVSLSTVSSLLVGAREHAFELGGGVAEGGLHLFGGRGQGVLQLARGLVHGEVDRTRRLLQRLGDGGGRGLEHLFHGLAGSHQATFGIVDGVGDRLGEAAHPVVDVVGAGGEARGQRIHGAAAFVERRRG